MSDLRRDQPLFRGVDHPSIACSDVATLAGWYCQNLGMRVITNNGMTPPAMILGYGNDLSDGMLIEMIPAIAPGPAPGSINRLAPGLRHLAIRVADFDAAHSRLKELGVKFTTEPSEALGGGRTVLFRDPEGNELQIVQRREVRPAGPEATSAKS